jgi:hypothetical protein
LGKGGGGARKRKWYCLNSVKTEPLLWSHSIPSSKCGSHRSYPGSNPSNVIFCPDVDIVHKHGPSVRIYKTPSSQAGRETEIRHCIQISVSLFFQTKNLHTFFMITAGGAWLFSAPPQPTPPPTTRPFPQPCPHPPTHPQPSMYMLTPHNHRS